MACATCNNSGLSKVATVRIICPDCRGISVVSEDMIYDSVYEDFEADLDFELEYGSIYERT